MEPAEIIEIAPDALSPTDDIWPRPIAFVAGADAVAAQARGLALPLAGGGLAFTHLELLARRGAAVVAATASIAEARQLITPSRLDALTRPRPVWAGLALDRPRIMGILNVTPDSFSDGGAFLAPEAALAHGRAMLAAGADVIDLGAESTRPGAAAVPADEQIRRIAPVLEGLVAAGAVVSIDTRDAAVMQAAIAGGARIINDVSALTGDPQSLTAVAASNVSVVLMHMQGEPTTMQREPRYALASLDVVEHLAARIAACEAAGIARARIVVDPGIGFGKAPQHNLEILRRLGLFHALGTGLLVGLSRKSLVGRLTGAALEDRLPGSLAGALWALGRGAQIVRVHDVAETYQAVAVARALAGL